MIVALFMPVMARMAVVVPAALKPVDDVINRHPRFGECAGVSKLVPLDAINNLFEFECYNIN